MKAEDAIYDADDSSAYCEAGHLRRCPGVENLTELSRVEEMRLKEDAGIDIDAADSLCRLSFHSCSLL